MKRLLRLAFCAVFASTSLSAGQPAGLATRLPWTASRITGSPDPPPPYRTERVFPKLTFKYPLLITRTPGIDRFFVAEQAGKIYSFPRDPNCPRADLFLDLKKEIHSWDPAGKINGVGAVYGLAFHPDFAANRYCYICYIVDSKTGGDGVVDGTRVARFRVLDTDPPRCDAKSETILLTWLAGGHNGGDLHFGPDGYLYISTGDATAPSPPDGLDTGQDLGDLLSSILRIDVNREEGSKHYAIPRDNPFVAMPKARPEIWAYGLRNPWRMSFDRPTGELWVGDVGWDSWEMVYRIKKGGNYGWSVMEGRQLIRPTARRGPTPILPPALDFPHTEAASITGGYVYRGQRLKELTGAYICGDYMTRKLWATRFEGDRIAWHRELAQSGQRVVAFGEDSDGELCFLHHDEAGSIHRLVPNESAQQQKGGFPTRLSETGLFASVKDHLLSPGVVPFSVNAAQWADHATAERFVALPGQSTARLYDSRVSVPGGIYTGDVFFPKDGVLGRTVHFEMECGKPASRRRLETQILHFDGTAWHGLTYEWNEQQTDATLVPREGKDRTLAVSDAGAPGGRRQQTWRYAGRTQCLQCHNPWAGPPLAFALAQLNKEHDYGGLVGNQLAALRQLGLIEVFHQDEFGQAKPTAVLPSAHLTDPYAGTGDLNGRARSYLHVNCAHCHQPGTGGNTQLDLRAAIRIERTKTLEAVPLQGNFGIRDGQLLAPADPFRSILYYRMAKLGSGHMPHLGSEIVDERGLRLIHDWIRQLPVRTADRMLIEQLRSLDEPAVVAEEKAELALRLKRSALAIARSNGRGGPTADDQRQAEAQEQVEAPERARQRATQRTQAIDRLLATPSQALALSRALAEDSLPPSIRAQILVAAMAVPDPTVRDLFERFMPAELRVQRLGPSIKPEQVLSRRGVAERGRKLFFASATLQCTNCHRVGQTGSALGPELSQIGKKYTRAQILESILEPSKTIEPQYFTNLVELKNGQVHSGLLIKKDGQEVVLRTSADNEVRIPIGQVAGMTQSKISLMPEQLLKDLTAEQAADLLDFLASLK